MSAEDVESALGLDAVARRRNAVARWQVKHLSLMNAVGGLSNGDRAVDIMLDNGMMLAGPWVYSNSVTGRRWIHDRHPARVVWASVVAGFTLEDSNSRVRVVLAHRRDEPAAPCSSSGENLPPGLVEPGDRTDCSGCMMPVVVEQRMDQGGDLFLVDHDVNGRPL